MKRFIGRIYYCEWCNIGYKDIQSHKCENICECLSNKLCEDKGKRIYCQECERCFRSDECYNKHLEIRKTNSTCTVVKRCNYCDKFLVKGKKTLL